MPGGGGPFQERGPNLSEEGVSRRHQRVCSTKEDVARRLKAFVSLPEEGRFILDLQACTGELPRSIALFAGRVYLQEFIAGQGLEFF